MASKISKFLQERLRKLRLQADITQEAYAEMAGMNYKYYQAIESGRKKEIRLSTIEKIAQSYGLEIYELFAPELPEIKLKNKLKISPQVKKAKPRIRR